MPLQIRRGEEAQRSAIVFAEGEIVYTTDTKKLYVGDGTTTGGIAVDTSLNFPPQLGNNGKFLTTNGTSVSWATVAGGGGGGLNSVIEDLEPTLGGDLTLNGNDVVDTGNINITGFLKTTNTDTNSFLQIDGATITKDNLHSVTIEGSTSSRIPFVVYQPSTQPGLEVRAAVPGFTAALALTGYRGTANNPQVLQVGDPTGAIVFANASPGRTDIGSATAIIGGELVEAGDGVTTGGRSRINFIIPAPNGSLVGATLAYLSPNGIFNAPTFSAGDGTASNPSIAFGNDIAADTGFYHPADGVICVGIDATEKVRIDGGGIRVNGFMKVGQVNGTLPNPPEAGMIVLDGSTFKGYNGTAWVALN